MDKKEWPRTSVTSTYRINNNFLISQPKHMLRDIKRTGSFEYPKQML